VQAQLDAFSLSNMLLKNHKYFFLCWPSHRYVVQISIMSSSSAFLDRENMMGNSLHNKIPLGRSSVLSTIGARVALAAALVPCVALAYWLIRSAN
jgi:hypothetical protein